MEKKQWIPVIIILFTVLAGMIGPIQQNNQSTTILIGIVGIVVVGIVVRWYFFHDKNQDKQLLQATSPQPLIDYYNEMLDKVPEVHLAFPKSLAYTLYGYFDAAKLEIDRVDYQQKPQPPIFQAQKAYLQALWTYLEKRNFQQGLNLSKEAKCLAEVPSALPNSFISLSAFDAAIEIGELLNGSHDPNLLASLRKRLKNLPPTMKVIVAWGLERFYGQSGQIQKAQEMRAFLTRFGSHCKGLSNF